MNLLRCVLIPVALSITAYAAAQEVRVPSNSKSKALVLIESDMYVVVPANRLSLIAYSTHTSRVSRITLDDPLPEDCTPAIANGVAVVQCGRTVYAIGKRGGTWSRLDLAADGLHFEFDGNAVRFSNEDVLYVFGSGATEWTGFDLHDGRIIAP